MTTSYSASAFRAIAILAILWNLFGVSSFCAHAFAPETAFAGMDEAQRDYMAGFPTWGFVVFGTAVTTGLLGSIGLLMKKRWAVLLFTISLIAVVINQLYPILFTNYMEIFGGASTLVLPMVIIAVAAALLWWSKICDARGLLH